MDLANVALSPMDSLVIMISYAPEEDDEEE